MDKKKTSNVYVETMEATEDKSEKTVVARRSEAEGVRMGQFEEEILAHRVQSDPSSVTG
jgi:ACT domain-containing protein